MSAGSSIFRARSGISLLEVLVAGALGLLSLTVMVSLFLGGTRLWGQCSCRSELQQTATITMERMVAELRDSSPRGVTWGDAHLCVASPSGVSPDGRLTWDGAVVLYCRDARLLRVYRLNAAPAGLAPPVLAASQLAALCAGSQPGDSVLSRDLERFQVRGSGALVELELALSRLEPGGGVVRFELKRSVLLRTP